MNITQNGEFNLLIFTDVAHFKVYNIQEILNADPLVITIYQVHIL